jgi:site-specific DNA recombinase
VAEEANDHGAALEFVTEDFEDSAVGRFIRSAKAFAAEVEREKIGERSVRGKLARVQSGRLLPGCRPLYGYRWRDDSHSAYAIDDVTGPVVRRIFAEALGGSPIRAIARHLTDDGIPTPRGRSAWAATVVHGILRHPSYAGTASAWAWRATGETKTIGFDAASAIPLPADTVPALIDRASWEAVQRRLARNKAASSRNALTPESALLRGGYARCGYCGRSMRVVSRPNRAQAYQCCGAQSLSQPCKGHALTVPELDAGVWQRVRSVLLDPAVIAQELARLRATDPTEVDLRAIDKPLADVTRRQTNLAREMAVTDDPDVASVLRAELGTLAKRKRELEAERAVVESQRSRWEAAQDRLDDIARWCGTIAASVDGLSYADKRLAFDALGVEARVWGIEHTPRWDVSASIPLNMQAVSVTSRRCWRTRRGR